MLIHEFVAANPEEITNDISYDFLKNRQHIDIPDDLVLDHMEQFTSFFNGQWNYIGNVRQGINYYGITIILNEDINDFLVSISKIKENSNILQLQQLCQLAKVHGQVIVHFGV